MIKTTVGWNKIIVVKKNNSQCNKYHLSYRKYKN